MLALGGLLERRWYDVLPSADVGHDVDDVLRSLARLCSLNVEDPHAGLVTTVGRHLQKRAGPLDVAALIALIVEAFVAQHLIHGRVECLALTTLALNAKRAGRGLEDGVEWTYPMLSQRFNQSTNVLKGIVRTEVNFLRRSKRTVLQEFANHMQDA